MKTRFGTTDIVAMVRELKEMCIGMRVQQIYDVDSKTYLIKFNRYDEKVTLLLESGIRVHTTEFQWPKNPAPSGFSMKLRKHIKNKRLENLSQLGADRILDFQFGINDAAYHVILELYDRGNLMLTDSEYIILNILRPRAPDSEDVKFIVREKYPVEKARQPDPTFKELKLALQAAAPGENLRKLLLTHTFYGPALIMHIMTSAKFSKNSCVGKDFNCGTDMAHLMICIEEAEKVMKDIAEKPCSGYIIQKKDAKGGESNEKIIMNDEFHPFLLQQHAELPYTVFPSFDKAVDHFFSTMESQKIDVKTHHKEREAMKKLENVKKDHEQRIIKLMKDQAEDASKGQLIELCSDNVEKAITIIRSMIANQMSWPDIWEMIQEAQAEGDPVAQSIKKLKLEINHFTMLLSDPFGESESHLKPQLVDINLDVSAYGNARKYYDQKRHHAKKEQKTIEASEKAFKNAERKTKETLKEVAVISHIIKARKPMWFEKFIWCISSENYLIIAGRDIQQNEVIVKRYMKAGDIYVHADIHGASSVLIKNPTKAEVPPKTLNEAGTLAVCYSTAWNAKIMSSAWWVYNHQVTKTAPTGEYLTTGSFMIRGKKNYLLPSYLILGFGFLFKLHEDCVEQHRNERKIRYEESIDESHDGEEDIEVESDGGESGDEKSVSSSANTGDQDIEPVGDEHDIKDDDDADSKDDDNDSKGEDNNSSDNEENIMFPDTKVNFEIEKLPDSVKKSDNLGTETTVIISSAKNEKATKQNMKLLTKTKVSESSNIAKQTGLKRGQKTKLRKIKEKYKDQDEEERALRMKILASAGTAKPDKRSKKKDKQKNKNKMPPRVFTIVETDDKEESNIIQANEDVPLQADDDAETKDHLEEEEDDEDHEEGDVESDEMNLLNSLTGCPFPDDVLLFAVPVCGPYTSMQNYKYKVKMMPGTGRRGKAAKTALNVFLHDKSAQQIEKDCLRSVKDQDISRNFPGKVKLSHASVKRK